MLPLSSSRYGQHHQSGVGSSDSEPAAVTSPPPSVDLSVKLVVIGGRQVGKSALTVRYLTKRYIGEYQSDSGEWVKLS